MVQCSKCGFLAVWLRSQRKFEEASGQVRESGFPESVLNDGNVFHAKCFIQKHNLVSELESNPKSAVARVISYGSAVLEVIGAERECDGYIPWIQGFHPKEHIEMMERSSERKWRLLEGLLFAVAGGVVAVFAQWVAKPDIPVVNISPPTVNVTTPPVNVTVQTPSPQKATKKVEAK